MKVRVMSLTLLLCMAGIGDAEAQRPGVIELGVYGRRHWFGDSYSLQDKAGPGARLGFFFLPNVEAEASAHYIPTRTRSGDDRVDFFSVSGRLQYNLPVGEHTALLIGAGGTWNKYSKNASGDEFGVGGLAGIRLGLGEVLSIRLDGTLDYMGSPNEDLSPASKDWHYGFQAGLSWLLGGSSSRASDDADRDGVLDTVDQCPGTPAGESVNSIGCPRPMIDSAAMLRAREDSARAALAREDSLRRAREDSARAAQEAAAAAAAAQARRDSAVPAAGRTLVLRGVTFATGTATLTDSAQAVLDRVAAALKEFSDVRVEVGGHTDNTGSASVNRRLSQQRADAVRAYLVSQGVEESRLVARGYGPSKPVTSNATAEGRAQNRRVELTRLE